MLYLDGDAISTSYFHEEDDAVFCKTVQDVEPILDFNQAFRNERQYNPRSDLHFIARVPLVVHQEWVKEWQRTKADTMRFNEFAAMKLREREYSKLRTTDRKI